MASNLHVIDVKGNETVVEEDESLGVREKRVNAWLWSVQRKEKEKCKGAWIMKTLLLNKIRVQELLYSWAIKIGSVAKAEL